MATLIEGLRRAEFLLSEGDDPIAYETVTFAATGSDIKPGTVLGVVTATGAYKPYASGNSDGSQTAVAITLDWVRTNASTQKGVVVTRLVEVNGALLTGLDAAARTALAARNVIVR
jgi:hypothetical protein